MSQALEQIVPIPAASRPTRLAFAGYPFEATGFGAAARAYLHAFDAVGIDLSLTNRSRKDWRPVEDPLVLDLLNRPLDADFTLCHAEPSDLPDGPLPIDQLIALTTWESDHLPERFVQSLNRVREVWAPSLFNVQAFRRQLSVPVFHLPHPLRPQYPVHTGPEQIDRLCALDASDFVFLAVATWQERKNLAATIEAFFRAFPDEPRVKLVIKTHFSFVPAAKAVARITHRLDSIVPKLDPKLIMARLRIVEVGWPEERVQALMRRANVYLSLHRGEGWCYPLFDAACAGTPIIATGYSGPMDYLSADDHNLVRFQLVPVDRGDDPPGFPFTPAMQWAEPNLLHAAQLMRDLFRHYGPACQRAEQAAIRLRRDYAPEAIGSLARGRLLLLSQSP